MSAVARPGDWQECYAMFPWSLAGTLESPPALRGAVAMGRARAALREAGYGGEPIVHVDPTDVPAMT